MVKPLIRAGGKSCRVQDDDVLECGKGVKVSFQDAFTPSYKGSVTLIAELFGDTTVKLPAESGMLSLVPVGNYAANGSNLTNLMPAGFFELTTNVGVPLLPGETVPVARKWSVTVEPTGELSGYFMRARTVVNGKTYWAIQAKTHWPGTGLPGWSSGWTVMPEPMIDAPLDGKQYARKDGGWDEVAVGGGAVTPGLFCKSDPSAVAFTKTGAGTAQIKAGIKIDVAGTLVEYTSATSISMPSLTAGTDYAIWVKDDATIQAAANFVSAPGAGNWRKVGGFHYAPGGNATARAGGDATPAINEYSFWDLKFRPACPDPRGMALISGGFWSDIYLLGVDHIVNGTSKYNVTIADGASPPKIPLQFGGNGSTAYSTLNWWEAAEVMRAHGKRMPTYSEFSALAFGTTEAASGGTDPVSAILRQAYTSKWGVMLATGNMWVWGDEFGGGAAGAAWAANTGGRGSTYQMENAVLFGGSWNNAGNSGSRASYWDLSPPASGSSIGARGVCDHLILD